MSLRRRLFAIVFAFIGLAAAGFVNRLGVSDFTELFYKQLAFHIRGELRPDSRIRIVGIDEHSIKQLEDAGIFYPFPRTLHAELVRKLADAGARIAIFDILFSTEAFDISEDEAMRDAIAYARKRGTTVILSCAVEYSRVESGLAGDIGSLVTPTETIMEGQPLLALVNTAQKLSYKEDERVSLDAFGETFYSQAAQAYRAVVEEQGRKPEESLAAAGVREHGDFIINYIGPDGTIPSDKFVNLFQELSERSFQKTEEETGKGGGVAMDVNWEKYRDAIVFIGSQAQADNDYFMTPFGQMFGVETNAQALNTLLKSGVIRAVNPSLTLMFVLLFVLVSWLFAANLRPLPGFMAFTLVLAGYLAGIILAFVYGRLLMDFTYPTATLLFSFFFSLSFRVLTEEAEKRRIRSTFGRYLAPDIIKEIIDNPELADLGGSEREVALLFSDIRSYSTISESLDPRQTVEFLNRFLTEVSDVIMRNGGFVDKFMGDGVMAIFGAPVPRENPSADAVRSALAMAELVVDGMEALTRGLPVPHFRVGIGIHYGKVVMGNVGSARRMDYTCIGDVVNVASRLETETKEFGTAILISKEVRDRIGDEFICELLGEAQVKGRKAPVAVYKVIHPRGSVITDIADYLPGGAKFMSGLTLPDEAPAAP
jgi:adenylate cyclase